MCQHEGDVQVNFRTVWASLGAAGVGKQTRKVAYFVTFTKLQYCGWS